MEHLKVKPTMAAEPKEKIIVSSGGTSEQIRSKDNMNCYKGVCKYKTNNSDLCLKDKANGQKANKCDMVKEFNHIHKCRYGSVNCKDNCYMFNNCMET